VDAGRCPVNFHPAATGAAGAKFAPNQCGEPSNIAHHNHHHHNSTTSSEEAVIGPRMKHSRSNPDISNPPNGAPNLSKYYQPAKPPCPDLVLKIYRADQSFKYVPINKACQIVHCF